MDKEQEQKLVLKIADLLRENKDLSNQLKNVIENNERLEKQNEKLDNIISSLPPEVLPKEASDQIKAKTKRFEMATVLYADIQGFKKIAEQSATSDIIDELDQIIFHFNSIVKKYKIEKIKTIGDAYMCAGGVPVKNITNPVDVVLAALEMQDYLNDLKEEYENNNKKFWDLKMGIHTGPVTATFSGRKKISYELKGDTVHIATRMASASEVSQINISIMTYELVKQYFVCEYNGKIPVKYKGDMEMYFLKRIKPAFSEDRKKGRRPNQILWNKYLLRQFTDLQEIILDKLEKELPSYLYYHNFKHTIDVINQAELIGYGEGVDDESILLLKTAALFHDAGHIIDYDEHEYNGTQLAKEYLPKYRYTPEQIDKICELIMATKLPPNPKTVLESIMCDSDLDYLGRSDFIPVSNTLYKELKEQNKIGTLNDWNKIQVKFLSNHQFFTETGKNLREVNKQMQVERIKKLIEE
ncbi:MAG TPA: guanylate cyclase [Bacteroidales bacterium]|jgi:class 3 adenylate cyclase/predicted metal-dependent HD superfamily phosphohydrolase|nr:guanylate cyclase [Bacteroidales bacterium]